MFENLFKVIHILEDLQQAEHLRMFNVYGCNQQRTATVWELEADLGISKTTVFGILMQDLGIKHVMAKVISWLLLPEQKEHCAAVANDVGRTVWGPKVPTWKEHEASLSYVYVPCILYLE